MTTNEWLGKLLSASFLSIAIVSTFQILRTLVHRHSPKSFLFGFLLICFAWSTLRCLFWIAFDIADWTPAAVNMVTSLPSACQVLMFSLLTLYYAKLGEGLEWPQRQRTYVQLCVLGNIAAFAVFMGWAFMLAELRETKTVLALYYLSAAAVFGLLVAAAWWVFRRNRKRSNSLALRAYAVEAGSSGELVMKYTMVSVLLSRCIYDILAAFLDHNIFRQSYTHDGASPYTFVLLTFWEIVPSVLVLFYFRTIPATPNSYVIPVVRCLGVWAWAARNCGWCVPPVAQAGADAMSASGGGRRKRRRRRNRRGDAGFGMGMGMGIAGAPDYYAYDDAGAGTHGHYDLDDLDDVDVNGGGHGQIYDSGSETEGSDDDLDDDHHHGYGVDHGGRRGHSDTGSSYDDDELQGPMSYSYNMHHSYDTGRRSSPDDYYAITPTGVSVNAHGQPMPQQQMGHGQHDLRMGLLSNNPVGSYNVDYHRRGSYN